MGEKSKRFVPVPGDDDTTKKGICPNCGKTSYTNAMGTPFCMNCGWWHMGETIYEKSPLRSPKLNKKTWNLVFDKIKEEEDSEWLDDHE